MFQPFIQTGQRDLVSAFAFRHWLSLHDEPNLHLYFYQQDVTDGMRSPENLLVSWFQRTFQEGDPSYDSTANALQPVIGLCYHSSAVRDIDRDALGWLCFRGSPVRAHAPNCSVTDCDTHIEWKLSSTGSTLHVYVEEEKWKGCLSNGH